MKNLFCIVSFSLIILKTSLSASDNKINTNVNLGVDTNDVQIQKVIQTWEDYLNSNPQKIYNNPYWNPSEKKKYVDFDLLRKSFNPSLYELMVLGYKPTILSVTEVEEGYIIRTMFAGIKDSSIIQPLCITNILATRKNKEYKLKNYLPYATKNWQKEMIGNIKFIFPPKHKFNKELAEKLNHFADSMAIFFDNSAKPVEYYLANSIDMLQKARGLDYYMGEGNRIAEAGQMDTKNSIVYSGNGTEWHPHEIVHIYMNPQYPNAHLYFIEGTATLFGGSRGYSLDWHLKKLNNYLEKRPDFDLAKHLLTTWRVDIITQTPYVIGGLFCKMAYEKGGIDYIKKLLEAGNKDEDFYRVINKMFGVDKKEMGSFIRDKVKYYTTKK